MPSIELPSNVGFGVVVGRFLQMIADGNDVDQNPETEPMQGSVFFTPSTSVLINRTALPVPVTLGSTPIEAKIDFEGYLTDMVGRRGVTLVATNDPDNNPTNWTYTVSFKLTAGSLPSFSIAVPMGATVDLSTALPVPSSPGIGIPQAIAAAAAAEAAAARAVEIMESGGGAGTDHGALLGLSDDDHPQYLNTTRGDARYALLNHTHGTTTIAAGGTGRTTSTTAFGIIAAGTTATGAQQTISPGTAGQALISAGPSALASFQTLTGATVGLGNVNNTSDSAKPISAATQIALDNKADTTHTHTSTQITDFAERVQDIIGVMFSGGNVTATYDDAAGTITLQAAAGGTVTQDPEVIRDTIGAALIGVGLISVAVNDAADTITISTTATANSTDAQLRDRSTHTGTQAISTVTSLQTTLDAKEARLRERMVYYNGTAWPTRTALTSPEYYHYDSAEYVSAPIPPMIARDRWTAHPDSTIYDSVAAGPVTP